MMDGERLPQSHVRRSGICPSCKRNQAPPLTYGETDVRRYVCTECHIESQRRADDIVEETARMRAIRLARQEG